MVNVEARIKLKNKTYRISVDLDEALKVKEGKGNINVALQAPRIFYDLGKGDVPGNSELEDVFGTTDPYKIAEKIIKDGEVQKTQEFRDEEREKKIKQVLNLILKNAVDQNGRPYTEERLKTAISQVHYSFDKRSAEQQMPELIEKLKVVIPIKLETKKLKLTVPAQYLGQAYGLINPYKEKEDWLANGNLQATINIPSGLLLDFYDKLNSITHGAIHSEEIKSP